MTLTDSVNWLKSVHRLKMNFEKKIKIPSFMLGVFVPQNQSPCHHVLRFFFLILLGGGEQESAATIASTSTSGGVSSRKKSMVSKPRRTSSVMPSSAPTTNPNPAMDEILESEDQILTTTEIKDSQAWKYEKWWWYLIRESQKCIKYYFRTEIGLPM